MSHTAPAQARTGYRRLRGILALLAALACLAGCTTGELKTSTSGTVTTRAGTATPSQEQLGAVSWPADGTSAADISGIGKTLIVAAVFGQPGTAGTILPNALQAGHSLVLALDRALGAGRQPGSRHDSEGPPQGPPGAP